MRSRSIHALAAAVIVAAAVAVTVPAARATISGDPSWVDDSKESVGLAQSILEHLGHLGSGSYQKGSLDAATRDAVRDFQRSHGLRQTGTLDWMTVNQLLPHRPGKDSDGDGIADARDKCPGTPRGVKVDSRGCPVDTDGDGVADGVDKCPGTPKGTKIDAEGCPVDSDKDGVVDGQDKCPDTPRGAKVDANGCPVDSDGDGVADGLDKCPGTPRGTKVNAEGCALDGDGDGVADDRDKCPDTPRGTPVDASGCPESKPAVFEPGTKSLVLQGVTFATGSARLTPQSDAELNRVAEALKANPEVLVEVGGHTDNTGSSTTNNQLSKARARAVVDYLVAKGISPGRLESKGYGSSQPIADNRTAEGRARNRRVELKQVN